MKPHLIALSILLLALPARPNIIYFDYTAAPVEAEITRNTFDNFPVSAVIEFSLTGAALTWVEPSNSALYAQASMATFFGSDFYASRVYSPLTQSFGATVDENIDWDDLSIIAEAEVTNSGDDFDSSGSVYFGIRIDAGGGNYHYGWARGYGIGDVDTTRDPQVIATAGIYEMAINNILNEGIIVGVIPEPGTLFMMGLMGLAAVLGLRRRKS